MTNLETASLFFYLKQIIRDLMRDRSEVEQRHTLQGLSVWESKQLEFKLEPTRENPNPPTPLEAATELMNHIHGDGPHPSWIVVHSDEQVSRQTKTGTGLESFETVIYPH